LWNLGHEVSHQTVANILKRQGLPPAPERGKRITWREFIRSHREVLAAVDFFTVEVWTLGGLSTYYVLIFMRIASRKVLVAGVTTSPHGAWMEQMARNATLAEIGFLDGCRYLLHDRDSKFRAAFDGILEAGGIQPLTLPPRSPNLNAHLERWNRSVKEEWLSKMILYGENSLRHVLSNYTQHFQTERNHQGKGNVILLPTPSDRVGESSGEIRNSERLGGSCCGSTTEMPHEHFDHTRLTGVVEGGPAARAEKQFLSQHAFPSRTLGAYGRLRTVHFFRGLPKAAFLGDNPEIAQMVVVQEFHTETVFALTYQSIPKVVIGEVPLLRLCIEA